MSNTIDKNLLVALFKQYSQVYDGLGIYSQNMGNIMKSNSIVCPDVLCGINQGASITIYIKSTADNTPLENFLHFFKNAKDFKAKDDCYYYDYKFTVEDNISFVEKIKDISIYTINFEIYIKKTKIGG